MGWVGRERSGPVETLVTGLLAADGNAVYCLVERLNTVALLDEIGCSATIPARV